MRKRAAPAKEAIMSCLLCTVEVVRLMERVSFMMDVYQSQQSGRSPDGRRKDMYEAAARAAVLLMTRSVGISCPEVGFYRSRRDFCSHCDARLIAFPDLAMEVGFVDVERKDLIYLFHLRHEWDNFS
eukprot:scaffold16692_cov84-Skeletonema_dohrnii-CCMP3373.AAC.6